MIWAGNKEECLSICILKLKLITMSQSGRTRDSGIAQFILRLQEDYKLLAEFNKDPDKVMNDEGITSEENRKILKSGDLLKIEQLLYESG